MSGEDYGLVRFVVFGRHHFSMLPTACLLDFCKSGYSRTITQGLQLRFATGLADFGEGMAENDKAGPLEALRRRDKEVFCKSVYSRTIQLVLCLRMI